jgi:hypothetical protein
MKKLIILIAILLLPSLCWGQELARLSPAIVSGRVAAVAQTCTLLDSQTTSDDSTNLGYSTDQTYGGQKDYNFSSSTKLCRLTFRSHAEFGTLTGYTYTAYVMTPSTNDIVYGSPVCTSSNSPGAPGAGNNIVFDFSGCTVSGTYSLVVKANTINSSNWIKLGERASGGTLSGGMGRWNATGGVTAVSSTIKSYILIYSLQ